MSDATLWPTTCKDSQINNSHSNAREKSTILVDFQSVLKRLGGDESLLRDMVGFFEEDAPRYLNDLRSALEIPDLDQFLRAAHSLRGQIATFSDVVAELVAEIEQSAPTLDPAQRNEILAPLEQQVVRLRRTLVQYRRLQA